jgi:type VI secretion system protein ImpE
MNASELYKSGRLMDAIAAQIEEVRSAPLDHGKRFFLFELLTFAGEIDRSRRQLEAISHNDVQLAATHAAYTSVLEAEQSRRWLFDVLDPTVAEGLFAEDRVRPQFLIAPPFHIRLRMDAAINSLHSSPEQTKELLAMADQCTPAVSVKLNDKTYESLRDADDLFGTVLEVLSQGNYYWVPLEQVETLAMSPPKYPRDLYWFPARLSLTKGPSGEVFLPALYPSSHAHPDELVRLGRKTEWRGEEGDPVFGAGLRLFAADEEAIPLVEFRELQVISSSR